MLLVIKLTSNVKYALFWLKPHVFLFWWLFNKIFTLFQTFYHLFIPWEIVSTKCRYEAVQTVLQIVYKIHSLFKREWRLFRLMPNCFIGANSVSFRCTLFKSIREKVYFVHCLLMMIVSFKWTLFKVRVGLCLNLCRLLVFCRLFQSIQSNVSSALSLCLNLLHIVFFTLYCLNDRHIVQKHSRKGVVCHYSCAVTQLQNSMAMCNSKSLQKNLVHRKLNQGRLL